MGSWVSLLGLGAMLALAWAMSSQRRKVRLRLVVGGLLLQLLFAAAILKTSPGEKLFDWLGTFFRTLLGFVDAGAVFVFGEEYEKFYFAFKVLPTIIFFSALMSVLYHLGVMQRIVWLMARLMQFTLGTSGAESLSAAANVFVGQTEAPLVIRPYVAEMTISELMAVMVGGFATIAGGVLAAYVGMGIDAGHLLTASVISAPAALVVAKILEPEVGTPKTLGRLDTHQPVHAANVIEAVAAGAADGARLAINVGAMLLAFLAMIAMCDAGVAWVGSLLGFEWSLSVGLGYLFAPLAWLLGIEGKDCFGAGQLLGLRMVTNEFIAYQRMVEWAQPGSGVELGDRSREILTYALCGFANFGSIGIQIGGISGIAPNRRADLSRLGLRAMLGGTLACFMTACVAALLI